MVDWLGQFALRFPYHRSLRNQREFKLLIGRWYSAAHEEVPDAVEQFWRPAGEVGVARFCVARPSTDEGHVLTLRAFEEGAEVNPAPPVDARFSQAIDYSRRFFTDRFASAPATTRVRRAVVQIDHVPESVEGPSVGLAALVAFVSLALRLPVTPEHVFTGVPDQSRNDYGPVDPGTLQNKVRAVQQMGSQMRLVCPPGTSRGLQDLDLRALLVERDWQRVVCEALGLPSFQKIEEELRQPVAGLAPLPRPHEEVIRDAVQNCLLAAEKSGLSLYSLEHCFDALRREDQRLDTFTTSSLVHELQQLELAGHTSQEQGYWRWQGQQAPLPSLSLERARRALALAWEKQGLSEQALRLRIQLQEYEVAANALDALASAPATAALTSFTALLLQHSRESSEFAAQLDRTLSQLKKLPQHLLRVVLRCGRLPGPFASLAARWPQCETRPDRLLWLQSVVEATLHTLVALTIPADGYTEKDWATYKRRPSLGTLAKLVQRHVPDAAALFPRQQKADDFTNLWNETLHHRGAWAQLEGSLTEEKIDRLASWVLPLLALIPGQEEELARDLNFSQCQVLDGIWLYRRGEIDGAERFWAYDSLARASRPIGSQEPPEFLPSPGPAPSRNPPLDKLPTPVACAWKALRQAGSPLERLAAIDEAVCWLLELALPEPALLEAASRQSGWGSLKPKRSLLEVILHVPGSHTAPWAGRYLQASTCRETAYRLIALLERLEHGAPPLASWSPWIDEASSLLADWIEQSPWVQSHGSLLLLGRRPQDATTTQFEGLRARELKRGPGDPPEGVCILLDARHYQPLPRLLLTDNAGTLSVGWSTR